MAKSQRKLYAKDRRRQHQRRVRAVVGTVAGLGALGAFVWWLWAKILKPAIAPATYSVSYEECQQWESGLPQPRYECGQLVRMDEGQVVKIISRTWSAFGGEGYWMYDVVDPAGGAIPGLPEGLAKTGQREDELASV